MLTFILETLERAVDNMTEKQAAKRLKVLLQALKLLEDVLHRWKPESRDAVVKLLESLDILADELYLEGKKND